MGPFSIFSRYMARQFVLWFFVMLMTLALIITLFELVELLRRGSGHDLSLALALEMSILKLPDTLSLLFHFAVLFAAMFTFWRLTRSQELVVARASGVSAWQFMGPVVATAALVGVLNVLVVNPLSAAMMSRFELLENRVFRGISDTLEISDTGLWLRQRDPQGISVIYAREADARALALSDVTVFLYSDTHSYRGRIDADIARLGDGYWDLRQAWISMVGTTRPELVSHHRLESNLTLDRIQDSFARPDTLSFWELPRFIETLEATGFTAIRHRLHYQVLLAQPLLLTAMVLFAAAFSLRQTRRGGAAMMVTGALMTGFVIFVLNDIIRALGLAENIPVSLAAWAPAVFACLIGTAALLHLEDG
jgi:lipopolysaccharide export system permease protein